MITVSITFDSGLDDDDSHMAAETERYARRRWPGAVIGALSQQEMRPTTVSATAATPEEAP